MKRLLVFLLCASAVFLSCKDNSVESALNSAEISMNDNPESSLEVLESIDIDLLSTRKQKAKYALLYSMALDKNYIDIKTDSIIAPAVKYYKCHGSKEERFLCNYYRARIYENAGDKENALLYAAKAETTDTSKISAYSKCLLYSMKGSLYHDEWRISDAIDAFKLACKYALASGKYHHHVYYTLKLADIYRYNNDTEESLAWIQRAETHKQDFTFTDTHLYNSLILSNMMNLGVDPIECVRYAENYLNEYPHNNMINWHIIAMIYLYAGNPHKAYEMLNKYKDYSDVRFDPQYYGVLANVLEQMGKNKDALDAHRTFATLVKNRDVARHRSDVKVIEERYEKELYQNRYKHFVSYIVAIAICVLLMIIYMNIRWKRERIHNESNLADLQQEYDALVALKERMDATYQYLSNQVTETSYTDQELMRVLGHRIKSLAAFLQKPIPDSLSKVASQIDDLKKNKNYIVDSIGLLYAVTYPEFVNKLRAHDLTSSEIGFCCLYLLGLNIPEAGEVIGKVSSVYNVNSSIRKKLNISGTNLDKWIAKCFAGLYPNENSESTNTKN